MRPTFDFVETPQQLLAGIKAYVEEAERLLAARAHVELAGLDAAVGALCARIVKLSPEESKTYLDELVALRDRVETLGKHLEAAQREVAQAITAAGTNQKAAKAYRKSKPEA